MCYLILVKIPPIKGSYLIEDVGQDKFFDDILGISPRGYSSKITIRVEGELDSPAEIYLSDHRTNIKFVAHELPKGKVDVTWHGSFYEDKARFAFLHREAKHGHLKLTFQYSIYGDVGITE